MPHEALVIDDDVEVREAVAEILDSLGHRYDLATCQEEARELLHSKEYSYYLVDLEIPVRAGRGLPRIQNGENLLAEIIRHRGSRHAPAIVITGHGKDKPDLAVKVMKLGAADYVTKPFPPSGETLDKAIRDALGSAQPVVHAPAEPSKTAEILKPGRFEGGEMAFYPNRVELCGVVVLRGRCLMRRILGELRVRQAGGNYVAIGGATLAEKLGLLRGQNAISEAVKDFRNNVAEALGQHGVKCGRQDVIQSGGPGYRLAESIVVREASHAADGCPRAGKGRAR